MFNKNITVEDINNIAQKSMVAHIGIIFTEIGTDYLKATMPVDHRTIQPLGFLHGGASVALAETIGSVASSLLVDMDKQRCAGLEINANHIKSATSGEVEGVVRPIHIGKRTHVWDITITNDKQELVCASRLTVAIIDNK